MNDLGEKFPELKGNWQVWWMVPQGQYHYFLSYGDIVFTPPMSQIEYVAISPSDVNHIQEQVLQHEEAQELKINFDLNYVAVIDSIPVVA